MLFAGISWEDTVRHTIKIPLLSFTLTVHHHMIVEVNLLHMEIV
jgi:hypothetical protein